MNDYLSVVYDEKRIPMTDYPFKLASYLFDRFNFKKDQKLLEIGCGRGEVLGSFQRLGLDCSGVDISTSSSKNLGNIDIRKIDISNDKLPYKDDTFDIVYHKSLIEHLFSPLNLMDETYRVLKPGSIVIILTPDWVRNMKVFYEDFTHCRPYDINSLRDLLEVKKFTKVYQLPNIWKYPYIKFFSTLFRCFISTTFARKLTELTSIKFFRWSVELMVLGFGYKSTYDKLK